MDNIYLSATINDDERTLKDYVNSAFNKFIDYLEEQRLEVQIVQVKSQAPDSLTYNHIVEDLEKCEKRINEEDYSGAITAARSLVEGVCNEVLFNITDNELEKSLSLPSLYKEVGKHLNLDTKNPTMEKQLKQVVSGLINIVNGLAEIRNTSGDAHHRKYEVNKHHEVVVVNAAKTVVTFLFNTYEYQLERGTLEREKVHHTFN